MRVAFFGGSFNPPHFGHTLLAAYARGRGFDRVLVVPVGAHAFGKPLAPFAHRLAMARLGFETIVGAEVSPIERELAAPTYTLNTLRALTERHPTWTFELLVGSDVVAEVERWHQFDQLRALAPLFVVERWQSGAPEQGFLLPQVSSTEVRHCLERRLADQGARNALRLQVPSAVLSYIDRHRLYLEAEPDPG